MADDPLIVACGEALIDLTGGEGDGRRWSALPGGSPLNVAVACGRLGARVAFVGTVGDDRFGQLLSAHLQASGVDTGDTITAAAPTTLAVVAAEPAGGEPGFSFHVEGTATLDGDALDRLRLPDDASVVHLAGSVSAVLEPAASTFESLWVGARRGLRTIDPNPRPAVAGDRAGYRRRLDRWLAVADVVKVSIADLAWIEPGGDPLAVARRWLDAGPVLVTVTRGAAGATAVWSGGRVDVPGTPVAVVDSIGAGDSFTGSLLASLAQRRATDRDAVAALDEDEVAAMLDRACLVAALTCGRAGADPPTRAELAGAAAGG